MFVIDLMDLAEKPLKGSAMNFFPASCTLSDLRRLIVFEPEIRLVL
jgi:hypothetical protein